jgi:hypothetical protein
VSPECMNRDLAASRAGRVVWGGPAAFVLAGVALPSARSFLWAGGFLAAGAACVANARRCGRTHCYVTGPLYLLLSGAAALKGLDLLSWSWWTLLALSAAGTFVGYVPEFLGKRYLGHSW